MLTYSDNIGSKISSRSNLTPFSVILRYIISCLCVAVDSKETGMTADRLRALCILTYSDNIGLQRSAALCFAELSTRSKDMLYFFMAAQIAQVAQPVLFHGAG